MIALDWIKTVFRNNVNSKLHILSCYTNFKFDATVFISKNFPPKKTKNYSIRFYRKKITK